MIGTVLLRRWRQDKLRIKGRLKRMKRVLLKRFYISDDLLLESGFYPIGLKLWEV